MQGRHCLRTSFVESRLDTINLFIYPTIWIGIGPKRYIAEANTPSPVGITPPRLDPLHIIVLESVAPWYGRVPPDTTSVTTWLGEVFTSSP